MFPRITWDVGNKFPICPHCGNNIGHAAIQGCSRKPLKYKEILF
jgi:hypothetical protein